MPRINFAPRIAFALTVLTLCLPAARQTTARAGDAASNLRAQDRMRRIASAPRLIVPGHDPAVFVKFPKPGGGVAKIE